MTFWRLPFLLVEDFIRIKEAPYSIKNIFCDINSFFSKLVMFYRPWDILQLHNIWIVWIYVFDCKQFMSSIKLNYWNNCWTPLHWKTHRLLLMASKTIEYFPEINLFSLDGTVHSAENYGNWKGNANESELDCIVGDILLRLR